MDDTPKEEQEPEPVEVRYFFKTAEGFVPLWSLAGILTYAGRQPPEGAVQRVLH